VIVLALNRTAARILTELMTRGEVRKEYRAFCTGRPEPDRGMWDWPLTADPRRDGRFTVDPDRGRPARTVFEVEARSEDLRDVWKLHLRLLTGRTHQIRVHAAHAGCPVLGDRWYRGAAEVLTNDDRSLKVGNLALHASRWAVDSDDWPGHLDLTCEPDEPFPLLED
jgi:23S rRNA-/tRNA-specific pseudouridylate synthase